MDGDSYLIQYLRRCDIKKKQLEKKKHFIKEENHTPRPISVWLKTSKFKPCYMEVTKPPTLVVRSASSSVSEKKVDSQEETHFGKVKEVEKIIVSEDKASGCCQTQSDYHEIKEAWTEQNLPDFEQSKKKTSSSLFNFHRKFVKDQKPRKHQNDNHSFSKMFSRSSHFSESMGSTATYVKKSSTSLPKKIFQTSNNKLLAESLSYSSDTFRKAFSIRASENISPQRNGFESTTFNHSLTDSQGNPPESQKNSTELLRNSSEPLHKSTESLQNPTKSLQKPTEPLQNSSKSLINSTEPVQNPTESLRDPTEPLPNPTEFLQNSIKSPQNQAEPSQIETEPLQNSPPFLQSSTKPPQSSTEATKYPIEHLKNGIMEAETQEKEIPLVKKFEIQINNASNLSKDKSAIKLAEGVLLNEEYGEFKLQSPDGENVDRNVEKSISQRELRAENPFLTEEKNEDNELRPMKEAFDDARDIGLLNISKNSDANNSSASNDVIKHSRGPNEIVGDNLKCSHLNDDTLCCVTTMQPKQSPVDKRTSQEMTATKILTEIGIEEFRDVNSKNRIHLMSQQNKDLSKNSTKNISDLNTFKSELQRNVNESRNNERVSSPEVFSLKSEGVKEALHCNSSRAPSRSERKLKSRLQNLRFRDSWSKDQSALSHDDTPARGSKNRISLQFDLPYKATLVKRETNVGQKLHRERKERESRFGVPQLVAVAPVKTSAKPIMSRPRRRSILQFFHKTSTKNELESSEEDNPVEESQGEKQLFNKVGINVDLRNSDTQTEKFHDSSDSIRTAFDHPTVSECTPFSSPKIFRRQHESLNTHRSPSSVAKSATYNISEKSSLHKKIEELRNIKKSRRMFRNLPIFNVDVGSLKEQAEYGDESISQEKTYKKQLPAILKLRKNIFSKRDECLGQSEKQRDTSQSTLFINLSSTSLAKQRHKFREKFEMTRNQAHDDRKIVSPADMTSPRPQTPLLPSVLQELKEKQQTIKWTNKMGNVFQVTAENGRYGKITCCKDPTYISHHVAPPRKRTEKVKNANKQRKDLAFKKWQDLSESVSHHCKSIRPAARAKRLRHKKGKVGMKEEVVVVFTNGTGNETTFMC